MKGLTSRYIGDRAFYRRMLAVAVPVMVQVGITNFVNLLDNVMVGQLGTEAMTGVSIANQLITVFNLAIFGIVSGAGIFAAQFFGKGDSDRLRYAFRFKLLGTLLVSLLGALIFLLFPEPLISLYLLGEGDAAAIGASLSVAREYLLILLIGFLPFALSQSYCSTLRETGNTVAPMVSSMAAVFCNLILNYILIFGHFGAPMLGASGAAIATVISRYLEAAIIVVYTHRSGRSRPFTAGLYRSVRIPRGLFFSIVKKTLPLMTNEVLWALGVSLLAQCYSTHGYNVMSANSISQTIYTVFSIFFAALGTAVGILVGQRLGASDTEGAVDTFRKTAFFGVLVCIAVGIVMFLTAPLFPMLYKTEPAVSALATTFIRIIGLCMPLTGYAHFCYYTVRSGGRTLLTFVFDSFYICGIVATLGYLLTWLGVPIVTVYLVTHLTDLGKCIIGTLMIRSGVWIQNITAEK